MAFSFRSVYSQINYNCLEQKELRDKILNCLLVVMEKYWKWRHAGSSDAYK